MRNRIIWSKNLLSHPKKRPLKETNLMTATLLLQRSQSNPPEGLPLVVELPGLVSTRSPAAEKRLMLRLAQVHPPCTPDAHAGVHSTI